jgi:hypothetical protein
MCGHLTPLPRGRDFITCACGLRLSTPTSTAGRGAPVQALFAFLALACMLTAAVDLVRRLR